MTFLTVTLFILGFFLILKGGEMLVKASVLFAEKSKIPPLIVGATLVSIATTFPETTISIIASYSGSEDLAVNTAIGAMVCNFALVLGLTFIISPKDVKTTNFISKWLYFLFCIVVLFIFGLDGKITLFEAILLFAIFMIYIIINILEAKNSPIIESKINCKDSWLYVITLFVFSALSVGLGANVLVQNVEELSQLLKVDEGVIGVSIIALGTNIPELVTTLTSAKQNNPEIGIGNIFGASILNCTLLMSGTAVFSRVKFLNISILFLVVSVIVLVVVSCVISIPILSKKKTSRSQGFLLLIIYLFYAILMVNYL